MSAGLKGYCCNATAQGIEELRKCCGGAGYLIASGIAPLEADFKWRELPRYCWRLGCILPRVPAISSRTGATAEGDTSVMLLQTARFLLKCCEDAQLGKELPGLTAIFAVMADADFDATSQRPPEPSTADEFLDLDFLLSLFEYRTLVAVSSLNRALQARLAEGEAFEEAWSALTLKACKTVSRRKIVLGCDASHLGCSAASAG